MNFYCSYIQQNMLVQGNVEKWVSLTNINKFSVKKLPIPFFKYIATEMGSNYMDTIQCQLVVNLTFGQNIFVKGLQVFMDKETVEKQVFSNIPNPPNLLKKVWRS